MNEDEIDYFLWRTALLASGLGALTPEAVPVLCRVLEIPENSTPNQLHEAISNYVVLMEVKNSERTAREARIRRRLNRRNYLAKARRRGSKPKAQRARGKRRKR